jgi:S-adenosylmethionine hydrolase
MERPGRSGFIEAGEDVPAVYFLSDYGTADEFVGVVHAVLHRRAPAVPVIDLGHEVPPFDVEAGAAMLVRCAPHLGAGVVLAVVDPGVGTDRRAVAVETGGGGPSWLVGPDNGLLLALAGALGGARRVISLRLGPAGTGPPSAPSVGRTFDGRDLFAPAAAHLALGRSPSELGTDVDPASLAPLATDAFSGLRRGTSRGRSAAPSTGARRGATRGGGSALEVPVTWIDRFGNVQLGTGPGALDAIGIGRGGTARVAVGAAVTGPPAGADPGGAGAAAADHVRSEPARRVGAFGDLDEGELGLLADSNGQLALVLRQASAARRLQPLAVGDTVRIDAGRPVDRTADKRG